MALGDQRLGQLLQVEEAAGQRDEALAGYKLIRQQSVGLSGSLPNAVELGIRRLSRKNDR